MTQDLAALGLRESATFDRATISDIQRAAATGIYDIRGWGAKRALPHFDDLLFLGGEHVALSARGLPGEVLRPTIVLGGRARAIEPIELDIPVTIAGMSFGALSANAKEALGRGATEAGTSTTTGDGGMTPEERRAVEDARLPVPPVALRVQPRRPAQGRRDRDRARPGCQARRRRHAARAEDQPRASPACARCRKASTSDLPAGIPTGPARTT